MKKGKFIVSECKLCKGIVWPPSDFCSKCFTKTEWRGIDKIGKILEFSKKEDQYFCLAEFENAVKIMGTLLLESHQVPKIGHQVNLDECGIKDGTHYFVMKLI